MGCIYKGADTVLLEKNAEPTLIERRIIDEQTTVALFPLLGKELLPIGTDHRRSHIIARRTEAAHDLTPVLRSRRCENQSPGSRF